MLQWFIRFVKFTEFLSHLGKTPIIIIHKKLNFNFATLEESVNTHNSQHWHQRISFTKTKIINNKKLPPVRIELGTSAILIWLRKESLRLEWYRPSVQSSLEVTLLLEFFISLSKASDANITNFVKFVKMPIELKSHWNLAMGFRELTF